MASVCCREKVGGQSVGLQDCSSQRGKMVSLWSSCGGFVNTFGRNASLSGPPKQIKKNYNRLDINNLKRENTNVRKDVMLAANSNSQ